MASRGIIGTEDALQALLGPNNIRGGQWEEYHQYRDGVWVYKLSNGLELPTIPRSLDIIIMCEALSSGNKAMLFTEGNQFQTLMNQVQSHFESTKRETNAGAILVASASQQVNARRFLLEYAALGDRFRTFVSASSNPRPLAALIELIDDIGKQPFLSSNRKPFDPQKAAVIALLVGVIAYLLYNVPTETNQSGIGNNGTQITYPPGLEETVEYLKSLMQEVQRNNSYYSKQMKDLSSTIDSLRQDNHQLQTEITTIKQNFTTMQEKVDDLTNEVHKQFNIFLVVFVLTGLLELVSFLWVKSQYEQHVPPDTKTANSKGISFKIMQNNLASLSSRPGDHRQLQPQSSIPAMDHRNSDQRPPYDSSQRHQPFPSAVSFESKNSEFGNAFHTFSTDTIAGNDDSLEKKHNLKIPNSEHLPLEESQVEDTYDHTAHSTSELDAGADTDAEPGNITVELDEQDGGHDENEEYDEQHAYSHQVEPHDQDQYEDGEQGEPHHEDEQYEEEHQRADGEQGEVHHEQGQQEQQEDQQQEQEEDQQQEQVDQRELEVRHAEEQNEQEL